MPSAVAVLLSFVIFLLFMSAALQILMVPLVTQVNTLTKALPGFAAQVSATMNSVFWPGGPVPRFLPMCRPSSMKP